MSKRRSQSVRENLKAGGLGGLPSAGFTPQQPRQANAQQIHLLAGNIGGIIPVIPQVRSKSMRNVMPRGGRSGGTRQETPSYSGFARPDAAR